MVSGLSPANEGGKSIVGKVEIETARMQTLPTKEAMKEPERGQVAGAKGAVGINNQHCWGQQTSPVRVNEIRLT